MSDQHVDELTAIAADLDRIAVGLRAYADNCSANAEEVRRIVAGLAAPEAEAAGAPVPYGDVVVLPPGSRVVLPSGAEYGVEGVLHRLPREEEFVAEVESAPLETP